jgi:hypothetical protein
MRDFVEDRVDQLDRPTGSQHQVRDLGVSQGGQWTSIGLEDPAEAILESISATQYFIITVC